MEVKAPTWDAASALRQVHHVELLAVHVPGLLDGERLARLLLEGVHEEHLVLAPFSFSFELLAVGGRVLAHGLLWFSGGCGAAAAGCWRWWLWYVSAAGVAQLY